MNFCHSPCPDISGDLIENLLVEAKLTSKEILAFARMTSFII